MLKVTNIDFFTQKSSLPTYPIGYYTCRADKNPYRYDRRADKNPYRHDRRADSQCQLKD